MLRPWATDIALKPRAVPLGHHLRATALALQPRAQAQAPASASHPRAAAIALLWARPPGHPRVALWIPRSRSCLYPSAKFGRWPRTSADAPLSRCFHWLCPRAAASPRETALVLMPRTSSLGHCPRAAFGRGWAGRLRPYGPASGHSPPTTPSRAKALELLSQAPPQAMALVGQLRRRPWANALALLSRAPPSASTTLAVALLHWQLPWASPSGHHFRAVAA